MEASVCLDLKPDFMETKRHSPLCILHPAFLLLPLALLTTTPRAPAQTGWGTALSFNGTDQYVVMPTNTWFGNEFTIEAWVYTRAYATYMRVLDFGNVECSDSVLLCQDGTSGQPAFIIFYGNSSSQVVAAPQPLPLNQWVHLAATFANNTGIIYVNGYPMATNTAMPAPNAVIRTNNYVARSNWAGDPAVNAIIDDVRIWNVARTPVQIWQTMGQPLSGTEANLLAYWKFDEGSGTNAFDATGHGYNGLLVNGPTWTNSTTAQCPAVWGTALSFDGVEDYVDVGAGGPVLGANFTEEAWIYPKINDTNWHGVLGYQPAAGVSYRSPSIFTLGPATLQVGFGTGSGWINYLAPNVLQTNAWNHVAATYDGTYYRAYVNGQLILSTNCTAIPYSTPFRYIGTVDKYTWFPGRMDEIRIWNIVRTASQIQSAMWRPVLSTESGLVAYYRFDEGGGITAYDASPNHNNGTLNNRPVRVPSTITPLPIITIFGANPMTNQFNVPFVDPGATAGAGPAGISTHSTSSHNLALQADGSVVGWGNNDNGQITIPPGATNAVAVAVGGAHSLALRADGSVVAWGWNSEGQTNVPASATDVVAIAAGYDHSLALRADGSVVGWGDNSSGESTNAASPASGAVAIAAGYGHSLALMADGSVVGWGDNSLGETTIPASAQSGVVAIAAGYGYSLALKTNGSVVGWGGNDYFDAAVVPATATNGVVAIAAGSVYSLALMADGSVVAWGDNTPRQNGNFGQTNIPATAQSGVVAIAAGGDHSLALKADGSVVSWPLSLADDSWSYSFGRTLCPGVTASGTVNVDAPGTYTLTYRVTNAFGIVNTANRTVVVLPDTTPPTLPATVTLIAPPGTCQAVLAITATDTSDPAPVVTSLPPQGSLLPMGLTNILCTARDASGNSSTGTVQVFVLPSGQSLAPAGDIWTPRLSVNGALSVASSADGTRLVAVEQGGQIYASPDAGATWTPRESNRIWTCVASSADGAKLVAAEWAGQIYTSTDAGVTWSPQAKTTNWESVASSADGTKLVAVVYDGLIYTSTDSGTNWSATSAPAGQWWSVASSADGTRLVAVDHYRESVYTSSDAGVTWVQHWMLVGMEGIASSADGSRLVLGGVGPYTSSDAGATWMASSSGLSLDCVASSADGSRLVGAAEEGNNFGGQIAFSADFGATWTVGAVSTNWCSVASSADGSRLVAGTYDGQIYTSVPTLVPPPSPVVFSGVTNQVVALAGANGTVVTFGVTATTTNDCEPNVPVTCTPPSGSDFPAGTNVVTCVAVDPWGYTNTVTFSVAVRGTQAPTDISLGNSTVPALQPAGTTVGTLSAIGLEPGDWCSFALVIGAGDTDNDSFAIVGNTLQTAAMLDDELESSYSIRVRATETGDLSVEKVFTITVTHVNHAPVLDIAEVPALDFVRINAGAPAGAVGTAVTNLVDIGGSVSDVSDEDPGTVTGVAITGADTNHGTWYYTVDGGTNWNLLGTNSEFSALLLAAAPGSRVYFQPQTNFIGTVPAALSFRAWDQTSGTNGGTADTTSNGWTNAFSTAVGAASQDVGWGYALSFNGTNQYVQMPPGIWFSNDFTIEAWVYERSYNNWSRVIDFGNGPNANNVYLGLSSATSGEPILAVYVGASVQWVVAPPIPTNQWVHLAATLANNTATIYTNGVMAISGTVKAPNAVNRTNNYVARSNWAADSYANAIFDELRIWNVALTQAQITNNFLTTLSGSEPGLVAYYRFDEGSGLTAHDATANHLDGQLTNGPVWVPSTVPQSLTNTEFIVGGTFPYQAFRPGVVGGTFEYQGYWPGGVATNATLLISSSMVVEDLVVSGLSGNIQPGGDTPGLQFTDGGLGALGVAITAIFDGGDWGIITSGGNAPGILATSESPGGTGGEGAGLGYTSSSGNPGYSAGNVTIASGGDIATGGANAPGISAQSKGGDGGPGGSGGDWPYSGGHGGSAGDGGQVVVQDNGGNTSTTNNNSHGILALSLGGVGGAGGASGTAGHGGTGGTGGDGGLVNVAGVGSVTTVGDNSSGILSVSQGGTGGNGGDGHVIAAGGDGGTGGTGGAVVVAGNWTITTHGTNAPGISANSLGGGGGQSASGGWVSGGGGNGGGSGNGGTASVEFGPGASGSGGTIETFGQDSHGIFAQSVGGFAGSGASGGSIFSSAGGDGGSAGNGGSASIVNRGQVTTHGQGSDALFAESVGGGGGSSGSGSGLFGGGAGDSQAGGDGGIVTVNNSGQANTYGANSRGIFAQSVGGGGGNAGISVGLFAAIGGAGGHGGIGSTVNAINSGQIVTEGADSSAIFAQSVGGGGGTGGGSSSVGLWGSVAIGGSGGGGGAGSSVNVTSSAQGVITTEGDRSHGIFAQSVGGGGGNGGFAGAAAAGPYAAAVAIGGTGGGGGSGGNVAVNSQSAISTSGRDAHGIFAQSVGGGGGSGGYSIALSAGGVAAAALSLGGSGNTGGSGDSVSVTTGGQIQTTGEHSYGILAQSVGGGGGDGGLSVAGAAAGMAAAPLSFGGSGAGGGSGGNVAVNSQSAIATTGDNSHGVFAQSVGGGGGSGGFSVSGAISGGATIGAAFGGSGGGGASAGNVTVTTSDTISTAGNRAYGILAQSIGGGGGDGGVGAAGGIGGVATVSLGMGGKGGAGGVGGNVDVTTVSSITTTGANAHAIFAQSVGGGGGSGGLSVAGGISGSTTVSAALGGTGGSGADASSVTVTATGATLQTSGDRSYGVLAQSVGGGGGDGGFSVAGGIGGDAAIDLGLGGKAGVGGNGAGVTVTSGDAISTAGDNAHGIFAQSVGGGGGSGGFSIVGGIGGGGAVGASLGGGAGGGGAGGDVLVNTANTIQTAGNRSYGILAQSIGGGGGDGGFSVAGGIGGGGPSVSLAMGGSGGAGGVGGNVTVNAASSITTAGTNAHAIFVQSVGGGGGSGGFSIVGNIADGPAVSAAIGGKGGTGADAGNVTVTSTGATLQTQGDRSYGLLAQSIGGGGGDGGFSVAGGISTGPAVSLGLGGSGGVAGNGAAVAVTNSSAITTHGQDSHGLFVQSVGGGGGSGGFSVAGGISSGAEVSAAIGGGAGGGGQAGDVVLQDNGNISTSGDRAYGILAQSVGGGGGDGGFSVAGGLSSGGPSANLGLGGSGGSGGVGGAVTVDVGANTISTSGSNAHGIFAQSVGGGGGSGGFSVAGSISLSGDGALSATLGGQGGGGADASNVVVSSAATISTSGDRSYGILAQSVGGGGGDGGFSFSGTGSKGPAIALSLGGNGSAGGVGRAVSVINNGNITTEGAGSYGVLAQSVGGGGGSGGMSGDFAFDANSLLTNSRSVSVGASLGGSGGGGGSADAVTVSNTGSINTLGNGSHGIMAQSVGGGGGAGGASLSLMSPIGTNSTDSVKVNAAIGGSGGVGGNGSNVVVFNGGFIETTGTHAYGVLAQSVGGGGGDGGDATVKTLSLGTGNLGGGPQPEGSTNGGSKSWNVDVSIGIGGAGGTAGDGGKVSVMNISNILTGGAQSHGIFAQSVGGGGGTGGANESDVGSGGGAISVNVNVGVGGNGGVGGSADTVTVNNQGSITTLGDASHGIVAQSIGGGGGVGGASVSTAGSAGTNSSVAVNLTAAVGGQGGVAGNGSQVSVVNGGKIDTSGEGSYGILAQSIGGGGGDGGNAQVIATNASASGSPPSSQGSGGTNAPSKSVSVNLTIGAGGGAGAGGSGGSVVVTNLGDIITRSNQSHAILAQSIGGGGGTGGASTTDAGSSSGDISVNLNVGLGGKGGAGGSAGTVTVNNQGSITTLGDASHGILAQSVGGGGGTGGASISTPSSGGSGSNNTVNLTATIGGSAANGGSGSNVLVTSSGQIQTSGQGSDGIFAQSVGGGGGDGGNAQIKGSSVQATNSPPGTNVAGNNWSVDLEVGLGGTAGAGGNGGSVAVTNSGSISTSNAQSHAIFAQSVGGGGGTGGASTTEMGGSDADTTVTLTVGLGGKGGSGGAAGTVVVNNENTLTTWGDGSHGIVAQSIGGGGGMGGASVTTPASGSPNATVNLTATLGGQGGVGGNGGNILVTSEGQIGTSGQASYGILAQSIGGGGGNAGISQAPDSTSTNWSLNLTVGSRGGAAGKGGAVTITNQGAITTLGNDSHGVLLQSIGGGGGNAGSAHSGQPQSFENLNITVGGNGGSGNDGGAVSMANSGSITTHGDGSMGVLAQSIGGGGGVGGTAGIGRSGTIGIGGSGGAAGDGAAVSITQAGDINTFGVAAQGIVAQSIGGGGGIAGNMDGGLGVGSLIGIAPALAQSGGSAGNGGAVSVASSGGITTRGTGANAIFAQSVGGGGGLAGDPGVALSFAGSVGGAGSGGAVSVTHAGNITTMGDASYGIFAQSAGGSNGFGGTVDITLAGNVTAQGADSVGIFAQSVGLNGGSNILINIESGTVQGGSGSGVGVRIEDGANNTLINHGTITNAGGSAGTAIEAGAGPNVPLRVYRVKVESSGTNIVRPQVWISRGAAGQMVLQFSCVTNQIYAIEYTSDLRSGGWTEVPSPVFTFPAPGMGQWVDDGTLTSGNDTVENYGTVSGSVDLGTGLNAFDNYLGATLNLGNMGLLNLGAGNALTNYGLLTGSGTVVGNVFDAGTFSPGNSASSLTIDGSMNLLAGANLTFDLDGTQQGSTYDFIQVTNSVSFLGALSLSLDSNFVPAATNTFTLMEFGSESGLFDNVVNGGRLATLDGSGSFRVNYTTNSLVLDDYQPGTNALRITSLTPNASGQMVLQFSCVTNQIYVIESTTNFNRGVWTAVPSPVFTWPGPGIGQWIDDGTLTGGLKVPFRCYRVRLQLATPP